MNSEFGRLLKQGIDQLALKSGKFKGGAVAYLATELNVSEGTIGGWARGERLPKEHIIETLAQTFVREAKVDQAFIASFLQHGMIETNIASKWIKLWFMVNYGPIPLEFQALVEEKTKDFVGRKNVFEVIGAFLKREEKGYFKIIGHPGMGKSAILAHYVKQTGCVIYFNNRMAGVTKTEDFLESICEQIIERYGLPDKLMENDKKSGRFLHELLAKAIHLKPETKLVIAIDALDEVDLSDHAKGVNILYLPRDVPKGVYFIVTQRPETLPLNIAAPLEVFDLLDPQHQIESSADIRRYIEKFFHDNEAKINIWLNSQTEVQSIPDFVEQLTQKSQNNFMYLRYVLPEFIKEKGLYQKISLKQLPEGLNEYYRNHWEVMGMTTKPLPRIKLNVIYILSEILSPASCTLIAKYIVTEELVVQEVLEEWVQFLHKQLLEEQTCYSLYHASFRDFLNQLEIVNKAEVNKSDINAQIADYHKRQYQAYKQARQR